jgi:hypothetical protein
MPGQRLRPAWPTTWWGATAAAAGTVASPKLQRS